MALLPSRFANHQRTSLQSMSGILIAIPSLIFTGLMAYSMIGQELNYMHYHTILVSLAFGLFYPASLAVFNSMKRRNAVDMHGIFAFVGNFCFFASIFFIHAAKEAKPEPNHFSTPHGVLGLACTALVGFQALFGILLRQCDWRPSTRSNMSQMHGAVGTLAYIAMAANIYFGTEKKFYLNHPLNETIPNFLTIFRASIGFLVIGVLAAGAARQAKKAPVKKE